MSRHHVHARGAEYTAALQRFFAHEALGVRPATARRYEHVAAHLFRFLDDVDVVRQLGAGPAALLESERQFGRSGAFFRVLGFDELVACLADFVAPEWLLPADVDARTQISLTDRLLKRLQREQLIDMPIVACAYLDTEAAIKAARRHLKDGAPRRPRLRLIPGGQQ
jgi:hypothetical protein